MKKKSGKNVYEKKVTLGRDENGMPIRKSITGRTIAELNERIEQAKQAWMQMNDANDSVLFATYARRWLENAKAVKSLNTRQMYFNAIEKHIIPSIGDMYFSEITLTDLQRIINDRAEKYETCNKIRLTLRQIFSAAIDEGIKTNVKATKLVLPPKKVNEKRPLTKEEKDAIFKADFTDEQRIFVHLLYYTGIRREEALALTVKDLDFESKKISIRKTIIFDHNAPVLVEMTKTSSSTRKVQIPTEFLQELALYSENKNILFTPPKFKRDEYMSLSSYVKFWNGIIKKLLPLAPSAETLTAHIFRHNFATMLVYSGISIKKAAEIMGHSNTQMIMQIYAHVDEDQERTAEKIDSIFSTNCRTNVERKSDTC